MDGARTIDTQCGIRCAGGDEHNNIITWLKPPQSWLITAGPAIIYLDLIKTRPFSNMDEGIYTCIVNYSTYINTQHIGIYNRFPGEM